MHSKSSSIPAAAVTERAAKYIYLASPWTPVCGGIYKVVDYLVQSQAKEQPSSGAQLRPLDTRSGGHAFFSAWFLLVSLFKILVGRLSGRLAGVHVNVAERLSLVRKGTIVLACRALGVPVVVHLHAQMRNFYFRLHPFFRRLARWVFNAADGVVVLGPFARDFVVKDLGVSPDRVELVYNGVPEPMHPRRELTPGAPQNVLFLGRLGDLKGVTDLLQAMARPGFDRARLQVRIAGGGDVAGYEAKALTLGVADVVKFEGLCDQFRVARLLAEADVLVLPSYDEVLPLVILEALANGVAVVCTPVGEVPAVLTDGVNTRFVAVGDVEGLANELQNVLGNPVLLDTLARNGRALYEQQFSLSRYFAGIGKVHQRCFGRSALPAG